MRQLKLMVLALTLLMGIMFTSCMDSGENGPQQWTGTMKVDDRMGYVTFTDAAGTELIPTNTVPVTSSARMTYIYCQAGEGQSLLTNPKQIKITFLTDTTGANIPAATTTTVGGSGDVTTNAPIGSLSPAPGYSTATPFQFSEDTIVLPILYRARNVSIPEDIRNKLARHSLTLVCYINDITSGATELKLYLCYATNDEITAIVEHATYTSGLEAHDITEFSRKYKQKNGQDKSAKIIMVIRQSGYNNKLDDTSTVEKAYEIEYKIAK